MEFASKLRWVLVVFVLLFVLIFVGWGLSSIAHKIFNNKDSNTTSVVVEEQTAVSSLEGVSVVKYIVDGPIVASTEQRSYAIEVTASKVDMKVYSDYGQKVVAEKSYANNSAAFNSFLQSLEKANALARFEGTTTDDDIADKGSCPKGKRYILEVGSDERRWTTSCDRTEGTAAGKMTTMRELFIKQIPDFDALVKGTVLTSRQ